MLNKNNFLDCCYREELIDFNENINKIQNRNKLFAFLTLKFYFQNRLWQRDFRDREHLQPDVLYVPHILPPPSYPENPFNAVTTRFVKTATNKVRCPVFCLAWTPEGRRLITGTSSGEFTLWNGLTFNFETILQVICIQIKLQYYFYYLYY